MSTGSRRRGPAKRVSTPRFSNGYFPLRNRLAILVETHSWRTYPERVRGTYNTVLNALELVAANGTRWLQLARDADARAARLGGQSVPLDYRTTDAVRTIDFLGYEYTRTPSDISGTSMTRYDERKPQVWKIPLRDQIVPGNAIVAPKGGYLVPPEHAVAVARHLLVHGIDFRVLASPLRDAGAQAFVADGVQFSPASVEGRQRTSLTGGWTTQPAQLGPRRYGRRRYAELNDALTWLRIEGPNRAVYTYPAEVALATDALAEGAVVVALAL